MGKNEEYIWFLVFTKDNRIVFCTGKLNSSQAKRSCIYRGVCDCECQHTTIRVTEEYSDVMMGPHPSNE